MSSGLPNQLPYSHTHYRFCTPCLQYFCQMNEPGNILGLICIDRFFNQINKKHLSFLLYVNNIHLFGSSSQSTHLHLDTQHAWPYTHCNHVLPYDLSIYLGVSIHKLQRDCTRKPLSF
jgi:hypothetical protein